MDEPNLRSIKKKSTEKELGDHTLKDLLYNQIFYTIWEKNWKRKSRSQSQAQGNIFEFC